MMLDRYTDWAIAHPVVAVVETILVLHLVIKIPTVFALIPGAIEELREKRKAKLLRIEEERRETYKGPWG